MIYPVPGYDWGDAELRDLVERLKMRAQFDPFLDNAADAIEFLVMKYTHFRSIAEEEDDIRAYAKELELRNAELEDEIDALTVDLNTALAAMRAE